jgi:hypothetical protein
MLKYYFDTNNKCIGIQEDGQLGEPIYDTKVEVSGNNQLWSVQHQGVVIDNKRYDMSVLQNNNGTVEVVQSRIDDIDSNAYKIKRGPTRDVDKAFAEKYNIKTYPSLGEQLDLLWHDIDNGLFGDSVKTNSTFYSKIKEVKDEHPKE